MYLVHTRGVHQGDTATSGELGTEQDAGRETKKKVHLSREARSESRRWLSILSSQGEDYGDLLKFNQLKVKQNFIVTVVATTCDVTLNACWFLWCFDVAAAAAVSKRSPLEIWANVELTPEK